MGERELGILKLTDDQAQRAADFYESYAFYVAPAAANANTPAGMVQAVRELNHDSLMDAASALRLAGQWALLFDAARGRRLMTTSALLWHGLGHGFGYFLLSALNPGILRRDDMDRRIDQLSALSLGSDSTEADEPVPEAMLHPQQQAYLLLAAAGSERRRSRPSLDLPREVPQNRQAWSAPESDSRSRHRLREIAETSPHGNGVMPIGALGMPLRLYWDVARHLLAADRPRAASHLMEHLSTMAAAYQKTIDSAMANTRLWRHAASPVDVADADMVGIALAAVHQFGFELFFERLNRADGQLGPIARIPLALAQEVAVLEHTDHLESKDSDRFEDGDWL